MGIKKVFLKWFRGIHATAAECKDGGGQEFGVYPKDRERVTAEHRDLEWRQYSEATGDPEPPKPPGVENSVMEERKRMKGDDGS